MQRNINSLITKQVLDRRGERMKSIETLLLKRIERAEILLGTVLKAYGCLKQNRNSNHLIASL